MSRSIFDRYEAAALKAFIDNPGATNNIAALMSGRDKLAEALAAPVRPVKAGEGADIEALVTAYEGRRETALREPSEETGEAWVDASMALVAALQILPLRPHGETAARAYRLGQQPP